MRKVIKAHLTKLKIKKEDAKTAKKHYGFDLRAAKAGCTLKLYFKKIMKSSIW